MSARDVVLSEATLGEIHVFEFVPAGEPTVRSIIVDVQKDTEFVFSAEYAGNDGSIVRTEAVPVKISITVSGADPVGDSDDANSRGIYELGDEKTFYWMLGGGAAVLLALVLVLIISHDRERRERKLRREMGRKRPARPAANESKGRRGDK